MKKTTIAIGIAIILSLIATGLIIITRIGKKPNVNAVADNVIYENSYIISCEAGKIRFLCQGNEYEVTGVPAQEVIEVADIVIENGNISLIRDKENLTSGRLLSYGDDYFEVENYGRLQRDEQLPVYKMTDAGIVEEKLENVVVGATSFDYVCENGIVCALIQKSEPDYKNIRVMILNHDQIYYDNLWIKSYSKLTINGNQTEENMVCANDYLAADNAGEMIIAPSSDKLYFSRDGQTYLKNGYEGSFIIKKYPEGLVLINELGIEDYVRYVLPSEMPVTFSDEALKAQAVCARTFAYAQMKNNNYSLFGANLDDSTAYQVYNNKGSYEVTDKAVADTAGKVVTQDNNLITCYYFSTCSGMTENMEVWDCSTPGYIKSVESKDESSLFYNWSAKLDISGYSDSELGKLNSVKINKKSDAGYVLDLELQFEKGKRHYTTENDIRKFMGNVVGEICLNDGSIRDDLSMLPSACFSIAEDGVSINGGGFGHGIGLSQYGANELATEGFNFSDIINYYYNSVQIKDIAQTAY